MQLHSQGWNANFEEHFKSFKQKGLKAGRVTSKKKDNYLITVEGESIITARITGKFRYNALLNKDFPAVGDWVVYEIKENNHAFIHAILPRENAYVRKLPISGGRKFKKGVIEGGKTEEQVIASNINTAFIVIGLDNNFEIRRLERFLTLVFNSGIEPVIILNKADLCFSIDDYIIQVKEIADKVPVFSVSAEKNVNMDVFLKYLRCGETVIFLGSSGVGKSTITNYLVGDEKQKIQAISKSTGKGRHTTTNSELIFLQTGGIIVDTPGVKELQLWGDEEILDQSFEEIKQLSYDCEFKNCQHREEPGCAIQKAINDKRLSQSRVNSYQKQLAELQRLNTRRRDFEKKLNKK
ncbi:ribosome small subunit-dependent GTPase A [Bacillus pseudomycoides]|uniref:Small ribosomal subunit biogenesis GTPase RsgA n=1 Tax=Bacillus pseudomycoides TaxID=64104 RepID=A0AA91V804_9BACI|nr:MULTISPECIES: ribosome small subunit-dependent GTPase A [Bacillus]PEB54436.1 ribosome small subunit-dependent GTPase A [Bacillus sp. AFS098217]PED80084.1 ribosome small subunit-dependent GTPase A [Bacillus pseudomycoides]PEU06655.1 ribosome small subunit-dependent GTPase A [Bacillus sp. AFS019443]PEU11119.1 ribosome small subunit-dependent GTPase A [Bacillus sp. AFS014408]PFW55456.1 ribosome small subunit-dependent GTPase A [Bacillus sp. AFS075034]